MLKIDLIRHGEPVGGKRYRGDKVDDPLSEVGWRQLWQRVAQLGGGWDAVVTSPLSRCADFGAQLAAQHDLPLLIEPDFREIGFGCWEGMTHEQVRVERPEEYRLYRADPVANRPPGAEDLRMFAQRVSGALQRLVERYPQGRVLVICHAMVMRMALCQVMAAPLRQVTQVTTEYASWLCLSHDGQAFRLEQLCN